MIIYFKRIFSSWQRTLAGAGLSAAIFHAQDHPNVAVLGLTVFVAILWADKP